MRFDTKDDPCEAADIRAKAAYAQMHRMNGRRKPTEEESKVLDDLMDAWHDGSLRVLGLKNALGIQDPLDWSAFVLHGYVPVDWRCPT